MDTKLIGKRIKERRQKMNLTQKDLAEKVQVTPSAINQYEKGEKTPSTENLLNLARELGVSSDYLLGASKEDDIFVDKTVLKAFKDFKELSPNSRMTIMANIEFLKEQAEKRTKK